MAETGREAFERFRRWSKWFDDPVYGEIADAAFTAGGNARLDAAIAKLRTRLPKLNTGCSEDDWAAQVLREEIAALEEMKQ